MSGQVDYLCVAWVLERHHVLRVQIDGATFFVSGEQALHEVEAVCVSVMTLFGEQSREPTVRFCHQIVYDDNVFVDLPAMMHVKGCVLRVSIATIEHIQ